ncbi:hypothetical protein EVAR_80087_1 [Eumeta japonica]|uniref:Uncharacterized protein n=1 Tax=Eumeta variegata TaxID=151549 RepID=A0A4C1UE75_EUMVA|nr:hypothetical protein EVAR_80087_1 [Eumeta japonica]
MHTHTHTHISIHVYAYTHPTPSDPKLSIEQLLHAVSLAPTRSGSPSAIVRGVDFNTDGGYQKDIIVAIVRHSACNFEQNCKETSI